MIKNIVFDYGAVLLDWNPHYLYDPYFGSVEKSDWFLENICTYEWNIQHDEGKPIAEGTNELIALHPEWEKEIRMYYDNFPKMISGQIEGMQELIEEYKGRGYHIYGITNWSAETFNRVRYDYPILRLIEAMVVSGDEHLLKPDPKIFQLLLERNGLRAEECVFVDDKLQNCDGARNVGFSAIQFFSKSQLAEDLEKLLR